MTSTLHEELKTVAQYIGYKPITSSYGGEGLALIVDDMSTWREIDSFREYLKWSAQISVWQKAFSEAEDMRDDMQHDTTISEERYTEFCNAFDDCISKYHDLVDSGTAEEGFKVLYKLIQLINKQKKQ